jgi:antitoxin component YwqK of YwqJK toxin-antitoxin module
LKTPLARHLATGLCLALLAQTAGAGAPVVLEYDENEQVVLKKSDTDGDGVHDESIHYRDGVPTRSESDTDGDRKLDLWITFDPRGRPLLEERDTNGDGKPDTFETYEQIAGKPSLKQRDEDKNGDGTIDVKSVYENGKLKQREISDPTLMPL